MKNKSTHHKDSNTFKFLTFSERIAQIDVDVFHKVAHEYESQSDENESYFYQTIIKWNVLNLSEAYDSFRKEIRADNLVTLPQILISKDRVIEILLKHLKLQNPLSIQTLLDLVVAIAKDLHKEFYVYFPKFLEVLIYLLDTKCSQQLEWTFTCLAYLFKILWRHLIKDINVVFKALLPLLSDNKPDYINSFAAESFSFVARKVKDKKTFLNLLVRSVKNEEDGIAGCGKLLFQVIYGVEGQFHSCADSFFLLLLESLSDVKQNQDVLFRIMEGVVSNILAHVHPQKSDLLWSTFVVVLKNLTEKYKIGQGTSVIKDIDIILKLVGQSVEYKNGKFLQNPVVLVETLMELLNVCNEEKDALLTITQICILLLVSKNVKISQEQASLLIRKLLSITHKSVFLYFVDNISTYSYFERNVLPNFLRLCVKNQLDSDCFQILTRLVEKKAPLCINGMNLQNWVRYPIDFKENTSFIMNILLSKIKVNSLDLIKSYDDYYKSLVCLPHLTSTYDEEIIEILKNKLLFFLDMIDQQVDSKTCLFLINVTVECIIHIQCNTSHVADFTSNHILPKILHLTTNIAYITALQTLSLIVTSVNGESNLISYETLMKINNTMQVNFSSPFHEIRLLTTHIYKAFENLSEFQLKHNADSDSVQESWKIFSIFYSVESTTPDVHTYRDQLQNLEKLNFNKPQMRMCMQTPFKTIPLRYLCGALYFNFQLLWEPILKIISSHALGMELNIFWDIFGYQLKNVCHQLKSPKHDLELIESKSETIHKYYEKTSKPDFVNYRMQLWKALSLFPNVAEAKTREVSVLLLDFIESEYRTTNSEVAVFQSIKQMLPAEENLFEDRKNAESVLENEEKTDISVENQKDISPEVSKKFSSNINKTMLIKTLLCKLKVFSQVHSPLSMYREPELCKLYFDLLQHKDSSIQKAALDCIMTYKHKYLTPYKENLYNLVDDKNFKNEITTFKVDKDSDIVLLEHREGLIPIVMQIVFSKMSAKTGMRTGGKSSGQLRRGLILRFLAGCQENEMLTFLQRALKLYNSYLHDDPVMMVESILNNTSLDTFLPPKRMQSTINLLNVILEQCGGLMGDTILSYLLQILMIIGAFLKVAFDNVEQVHSGYLSVLKLIRSSAMKMLGRFFSQFVKYSWNNKQINTIFELFVWPNLSKLNIESIHSPTALLKLIAIWASNPRYFPLLVKCKENEHNQYVLPYVMKLLVNEKTEMKVINAIEEMLENLLTLQPDEEDEQMSIPVDNQLPVDKKELNKIGLDGKLNYGSMILVPHVPIILDKIQKNLLKKSKYLNKKELFILSAISEMIWEPIISDKILSLLLPVVLKRCTFSSEDVVLKYMTTVDNLIKNVLKPQIHLKEISPLFGEISYPSCRKILCHILEVIAEKSEDEKLKSDARIITKINAFDRKWIDQPDFELRHEAFKDVNNIIQNEDINIHLGILVVYNCSFFMKSEKDLSLREISSHTLKCTSSELLKKHNRQSDYILDGTLFTLIRAGLKSPKDEIRNEYISLLGHLARECPECHVILRDFNKFTNKNDLEVDFFENLIHLQIHRQARALLKFCHVTREQLSALNPKTIMLFILPLTTHYLCKEKFSSKNSLIDAAIETVGTACRILPWHQYEGVLKYYLTKLSGKLDFQKQLVRLIVSILDAFHFDLRRAILNETETQIAETNKSEEKESPLDDIVENKEEEENVLDDQTYSELESEQDEDDENVGENDEDAVESGVKVCEKVNVLCKSTATRVIRTIKLVLLPMLHRSLAEMTQHESSHKVNRKKTGSDREEEDLLRVPISLALVKLLQRLPKQILEDNLPGIFMKTCTFLRSHLESVRRVAKETLQKIMLTLGPKYLALLLGEMASLLNRGYQVHVLVFTIHGILNCLKELYKPSDIDDILLTVMNLCTADLFGTLSEEKEVVKIAVKVAEARQSKSYDTLQIMSQYITESCLLDIILPIKQVLETSHSFKITVKAQTALKHVALGLVDNTFISVTSLLKFAYGTASKSIPQLIPKLKKEVSKKASDKRLEEKEDCFIIPKVPGNRELYRRQNVKTAVDTNAHLLIEFGLRLCLVILKREKLKFEEFRKFVDPFVVIFKNCLKSKHVKLCTLTLQCLSWILKYDLPSLRCHIKSITKDIFSILHKYASAGLSKGDNFDLVVSAFKSMAVLVRDVKFHTIDTNQIKILILYIEQDIHDHDRQVTAFNLLKAIIARKVNIPELNDVMEKVAELSIVSELDYIRSQARGIFHQFLMEYPLGNTLEKHLGFYLSQMSYELKFGRESSLEMIHLLINTFPVDILKYHSGTLLITLGTRLVNDEEPDCRKKVAECITTMLNRLSKLDRDSLFDILIIWMKDKNIGHCRLASQLCGLFVLVEKTNFETRFPIVMPLILKQFGFDNLPGKMVKVRKEDKHKSSEEHQRIRDHHLFQVLQLLLKLSANCPSFLKHRDIEDLSVNAQALLSYPHDWVRLAAAQFLGYVLSTIDIEHLATLLISCKSESSGYLLNNPSKSLKSLTLDLCDQLQPGGIKSDLAEQVIKNLVFVAKVLQSIPVDNGQDGNKLNLLWIAKRLRKVVNTEIVENSSDITLRTEVFKWIAGVATALDVGNILPVLHHLMAPLVREMITTEEKNAPLRQLAKEVSNLLKTKLGMEIYTDMISKLQQTLSVKRAERKRTRKQLAVTDPEIYAKKKIKRHERKKEARKRKISDLKGTKRIFKKRKTIDLEDNAEVY
ncbi:LOW QUALITY PROTEIN: small subunit processome component 20 homolog [Leptinotarsa decemlineata]|uniref:LOW QUALITY PROTEIN: small subunit processome component 20 homolog n=1 Tax=Leptinotarsa decemlineata TaxID=7539 RepID=UPI003D3099B9